MLELSLLREDAAVYAQGTDESAIVLLRRAETLGEKRDLIHTP